MKDLFKAAAAYAVAEANGDTFPELPEGVDFARVGSEDGSKFDFTALTDFYVYAYVMEDGSVIFEDDEENILEILDDGSITATNSDNVIVARYGADGSEIELEQAAAD